MDCKTGIIQERLLETSTLEFLFLTPAHTFHSINAAVFESSFRVIK